ncbi:MAG TPA: hypothetical protein VFR55_04270 [Dehalococcoidia bacterium]|nr:hypothetical protein [Dehalococcoidia bacterium]
MPHVYLAPWEWKSGDTGDSWDAPEAQACVQRLDLRPLDDQGNPQFNNSLSYFAYDRQVSIPGATYFGSDFKRALTQRELDSWKGLLNISETLEGATLEDVLWNTLTIHAEANGQNRVRPLMPGRDGRLRLDAIGRIKRLSTSDPEWSSIQANLQHDYRHIRQRILDAYEVGDARRDHYKKVLGSWRLKYGITNNRAFIPSDLPDEGFLDPSTSVSDDFNRTDENVEDNANWEVLTGSLVIVTNEVTYDVQNGHDNFIWASDLASDDMYSQVDVTTLDDPPAAGDIQTGVGALVRGFFDGSGLDCYQARLTRFSTVGGADRLRLVKYVNNTFTQLAQTNQTISVPDTVKVEADGSTITSFFNGAQVDQVTDTAITGVLRPGIHMFRENTTATESAALDNFDAADLAGPQTITLTPVTRKMIMVAPTLAGSGQASVAPAPVTRAQKVQAPTVAGSGQASVEPAPVAMAQVVQAPTVAGSGSASIAPAPVERSQVVVAPTVAATGGISVSPAPVTRRQQVVAPAAAGTGNASIALTPVTRRHIVVAPALAGSGSAGIAPAPVTRSIVVVAPAVTSLTNVTLTALVRRMQVVAPVVSPTGTATIALTPVARRMLPVAPVVSGTGVALILLIPISRSMVIVAPVVAGAIATGIISLEGLSDSIIRLEGLSK